MPRTRILPLIPLLVTLLAAPPLLASTEKAHEKGLEILILSYLAHGGDRALAATDSIALELEGTLDRGARHQGTLPSSMNPGLYRERLVVDRAEDRVGWSQYHERYDGAIEDWRFVYYSDDRMQFFGALDGIAVDVPEPAAASRRERLPRILPVVLLDDVISNAGSVRYLGVEPELDAHVVSAVVDGELIDLVVNRKSGLLETVRMVVDETLSGDTLIEWRYDGHEEREGFGPLPTGYEIWLGGRRVKDVTVVSAQVVSDEPIFEVPEGTRFIESPPPAGDDQPAPSHRVVELAPWVWQIRGIRSGFNVPFFELEDYVVVFEAPAGWLEIHEIPASNFVPGATSSSTSERLIEVVREYVPDKPIRYLVLSHFHGDHSGGLRPFIREGATIVTTPDAEAVLERSARNSFRVGGELRNPGEPEFLLVDDRWTISDGDREIEILEIDENPHVDGLLALWLPEEKLLFVADLFHASSLESYPARSELSLQLAFIDWLDQVGLEPERVLGVHGGIGTPGHLERLRELRRSTAD